MYHCVRFPTWGRTEPAGNADLMRGTPVVAVTTVDAPYTCFASCSAMNPVPPEPLVMTTVTFCLPVHGAPVFCRPSSVWSGDARNSRKPQRATDAGESRADVAGGEADLEALQSGQACQRDGPRLSHLRKATSTCAHAWRHRTRCAAPWVMFIQCQACSSNAAARSTSRAHVHACGL